VGEEEGEIGEGRGGVISSLLPMEYFFCDSIGAYVGKGVTSLYGDPGLNPFVL